MAKGNWRDDIDKELLSVLRKRGVRDFLSVAREMLSIDAGRDVKFRAQLVGEVCECVFMGLTQKYLEITQQEAKLYHSVVLKDLHNLRSNFRTELDFVLVSPGFILTTECKSYAGDVTVTGKCTLSHRGMEYDVWSQSKLHHDKLVEYGKQLILPGTRVYTLPVFANVFLFSKARLDDRRSDQSVLRVNTSSTIFKFYEQMFKKYQKRVFDYERACKIFRLCSASKKLHAQHGEYVGYSD